MMWPAMMYAIVWRPKLKFKGQRQDWRKFNDSHVLTFTRAISSFSEADCTLDLFYNLRGLLNVYMLIQDTWWSWEIAHWKLTNTGAVFLMKTINSCNTWHFLWMSGSQATLQRVELGLKSEESTTRARLWNTLSCVSVKTYSAEVLDTKIRLLCIHGVRSKLAWAGIVSSSRLENWTLLLFVGNV